MGNTQDVILGEVPFQRRDQLAMEQTQVRVGRILEGGGVPQKVIAFHGALAHLKAEQPQRALDAGALAVEAENVQVALVAHGGDEALGAVEVLDPAGASAGGLSEV